jgi:hypothetical protein
MKSETFTIKGKLGPLGKEDSEVSMELRPFTLLIGVQGVGKSFLSQFLYFFRNAHYLFSKYHKVSKAEDIDALAAWLVEGLRAGTATSRSLASMALTPTVNFKYQYGDIKRSLSIYRNRTPRIHPLADFQKEIDAWLQAQKQPFQQAVFIPDERSYYSRFFNTKPIVMGDSATSSIPMLEFTEVMQLAAGISLKWQKGEGAKPREAQRISDLSREALRGQAMVAERGLYANNWVWQSLESDNVIDIEMASSGQKEAWPLVVTLEALFAKNDLPLGSPLSLYVEEPESHLHPAAQVSVLKMLVYLVKQGHRVTVTTHSLTVLYALNNLMLGFRRDPEILDDPDLALDPEMVSAYHLKPNGEIEDLLDRGIGFIDEVALGYMNDRLATQFYQFAGSGE